MAAKRTQQRDEGEHRGRQGEQDVQQGLPADGANVASGEEQNGIHTHRFGGVASHNVQCAPTRVQV